VSAPKIRDGGEAIWRELFPANSSQAMHGEPDRHQTKKQKAKSEHQANAQQLPTNPNPTMMTTTTTTTTSWPDAAPLAGEELIFSISCGNSHLHWATHFGEDQEFSPDMFWR